MPIDMAYAIGSGLKGFTSGAAEGAKIGMSIANMRAMREYRGAQAQYFRERGDYYKKRGETLSQMPPEAMDYYHKNAVWDHTNRQMDALSEEIQKSGQNADPALMNKYVQLKQLLPKLRQQLDTAYTKMIGKGVDPMHLNPLIEQSNVPAPVPPRPPNPEITQPGPIDSEERSADQEDQGNQQNDLMDNLTASPEE